MFLVLLVLLGPDAKRGGPKPAPLFRPTSALRLNAACVVEVRGDASVRVGGHDLNGLALGEEALAVLQDDFATVFEGDGDGRSRVPNLTVIPFWKLVPRSLSLQEGTSGGTNFWANVMVGGTGLTVTTMFAPVTVWPAVSATETWAV